MALIRLASSILCCACGNPGRPRQPYLPLLHQWFHMHYGLLSFFLFLIRSLTWMPLYDSSLSLFFSFSLSNASAFIRKRKICRLKKTVLFWKKGCTNYWGTQTKQWNTVILAYFCGSTFERYTDLLSRSTRNHCFCGLYDILLRSLRMLYNGSFHCMQKWQCGAYLSLLYYYH